MDDFERFWAAYPRRVGKFAAQKAYVKARNQATEAEILDGVALYIQHKPEYADFCHPATWLNQGRWMDEHEVPQTKAVVGSPEYYARSWRMQCQHDPPCASSVWHSILVEKEAKARGEAV